MYVPPIEINIRLNFNHIDYEYLKNTTREFTRTEKTHWPRNGKPHKSIRFLLGPVTFEVHGPEEEVQRAADPEVTLTAMSKPQIDAAPAITDNRRSYRERRTYDSSARRNEAGLTENRKSDRRIE